MSIPDFNTEGLLPEEIHDSSLQEVMERFGQFQRSDRRCRLYERLQLLVQDASAAGSIDSIVIDGSFVTSKDEPNDIDLILIVRPSHDFSGILSPREYNLLSRRDAKRKFGFDVLVAREGRPELDEYIEFFAQVRGPDDLQKGLVRIKL